MSQFNILTDDVEQGAFSKVKDFALTLKCPTVLANAYTNTV